MINVHRFKILRLNVNYLHGDRAVQILRITIHYLLNFRYSCVLKDRLLMSEFLAAILLLQASTTLTIFQLNQKKEQLFSTDKN